MVNMPEIPAVEQAAGSWLAANAYRRDRWWVITGIVAVSALAWGYMLMDAYRMQTGAMSAMWMPPTGDARWSLADFGWTFFMWTVMMIAMMTPSATPVALMVASVNRQRAQRRQAYAPTAFFLFGYLLAWTLFSVLATALQWPMHAYAWLTPMMDNNSRMLAGGVLLLAGLYQFTPWKEACLRHCRTPVGFLMTQWREGRAGAVKMGFNHGLFCVGCCWALMLVLFAVGVMNMVWVALITVFVLMEKVLPLDPRYVRWITGSGLIAWAMQLFVVNG